ncbi:MAG: hypothetical protein JWM98_1722, partial [Thermoleophilia bacterium]|nr:hypothetical protein [Thermoleophilia bacterium]
DGTLVNLEGRLQRTTVGAEPPAGVRAPLRWIAGLGRRLGAKVPSHAAGAYRTLLAAVEPGRLPAPDHGSIPPEGILGVTGGPAPIPVVDAAPELADGELTLYVAPNLYDHPAVAHTEAMDFLHADARLTMSRDDARARGLARGSRALVTVAGREVEVTVTTSTRLLAGHARVQAGTPGFAPGRTGWFAARVEAIAGSGTVPASDSDPVATPLGAGADLDAPPTLRGEGN